MTAAAWLGLGLGSLIGVGCGLWQARDLRQSAATGPSWRTGASAALRLAVLTVALVAAWRFGRVSKSWLAGSVAVTYSVMLIGNLRGVMSKNK